ncbi:4-alpha-glucanotransferase [Desulfoprunum benzoelyticum]|uniref:4-alpha-glucanotransferase n=1 Tax=Desulfoprunum benzoelyticum TaxID=1506996 RepID=A0A840UZ23_9BACT|nr:4-alpha-glucanotransferase [Desulfoprunum benzoelyticum]MBB5346699.1 4-alpha-glucanotransferase [Desulfoprunum benzoelyticum]MBM9529057.1 4-alpha-glucanotransferase [Desulfoprunum benzoelyticum]
MHSTQASRRASGILAHISSLPSPYGIGDIGPSSYAFLDFLLAAGQSCWQFLPTVPTNSLFDNSPYMSSSAFAGSPLLISPELLYAEGLISDHSLRHHPDFSPYSTDYAAVTDYKEELLTEACERFSGFDDNAFHHFTTSSPWLDDYALFMTLKEKFGNAGWFDWPSELARRDSAALAAFKHENMSRFQYFRFEQYEFFRQWRLLRQAAEKTGVRLFGDLPVYVGLDSVDVWTHQSIFALDERTLLPTHVAGVPPDYFSATGQRWGNPLYRWHTDDAATRKLLADWWTSRIAAIFSMVDMARIDHFRGFESYWSIPAACDTAVEGQWQRGPGKVFFDGIFERLGRLDIIAEDLGIITPEVLTLRDSLGFPGMKVLQFAFDGNPANSFLPYNYTTPNCVVYTGTHDNDTTVGWFLSDRVDDGMRREIKGHANRRLDDGSGIHEDLIYMAMASIGRLTILPLQDLLGFGSDCRMNTPGLANGNWRWRCAPEYLTPERAAFLNELTVRFGRERAR